MQRLALREARCALEKMQLIPAEKAFAFARKFQGLPVLAADAYLVRQIPWGWRCYRH